MAKRIEFKSQIELPIAAESEKNAVRKQEFDSHVNSNLRHLPPGGLIGQVVVMTATGMAWKWPHVVCGCGTGKISFETAPLVAALQGIDFNAVREVEIE